MFHRFHGEFRVMGMRRAISIRELARFVQARSLASALPRFSATLSLVSPPLSTVPPLSPGMHNLNVPRPSFQGNRADCYAGPSSRTSFGTRTFEFAANVIDSSHGEEKLEEIRLKSSAIGHSPPLEIKKLPRNKAVRCDPSRILPRILLADAQLSRTTIFQREHSFLYLRLLSTTILVPFLVNSIREYCRCVNPVGLD